MRKLFLILALAGFSTVLQAGPITPEKALKVAERVLAAQPVTKAGSGLHIIWDGESVATKAEAETPAFYVVARDCGGFVIVAGNDNVQPVLALSYTNRFQVEDMPCNVSAWMERIKRYSRGALEATPEVRAQWDRFEETKSQVYPDEGVTKLSDYPFTVQWNQRAPSNLLAPQLPEQEQAVCGCLPLAFSELMVYFGRPDAGTGQVPGYSYQYKSSQGTKTYSIDSHNLGTEYRWREMQALDTYEAFSAESNSDLGRNVAQLLYDVGTLMQVHYGQASSGGTGGYTYLLTSAFCPKMKYSKAAIEREYSYGYTLAQWNQMLIEEVSQHPVYYSGSDYASGGGHAYVVDGYGTYEGNTVFHFNFGWAGVCNGYYYADYQFTPDGEEFGSVSAIFGFVPDPEGTSDYVLELSYGDLNRDMFGRVDGRGTVSSRSGNTMTITGYLIMNTGSGTFNGVIDLFRVNKNGEQADSPVRSDSRWNISGFDGFTYSGGNLYWNYKESRSVQFNLTGEEVLGDKFAYYYKPTNGEWTQMKYSNPSAAIYEQPVYPAAFIKKEAAYHVGDNFYFRLTNHNYTYSDAVWKITDPSGTTTSYPQEDEWVKLTEPGKYKISVDTGEETLVTVINVN